MTSAARQPRLVSLEVPARAVELIWDLSARAGRALAIRREVADPAIVGVAVRLSRLAGGRVDVVTEALTASGDRCVLLGPGQPRARWLREGAFEHLDVEDVLACTLRHESHTSALFARCPLLARLGIPPGSYSLRGAEIV